MTKGAICEFDFYVIGLDTQKVYNEKMYEKGLSLQDAITVFKDVIIKYPNAIIALGVSYITNRYDLNNMGEGAVDLIHFDAGSMRMIKDYLKSEVINQEAIIYNNTVSIIKKTFIKELQTQ